MSIAGNLRDKRALVLRLIIAEVLAKPGTGPLAPRFPLPKPRVRSRVSAPTQQTEGKEPAP